MYLYKYINSVHTRAYTEAVLYYTCSVMYIDICTVRLYALYSLEIMPGKKAPSSFSFFLSLITRYLVTYLLYLPPTDLPT